MIHRTPGQICYEAYWKPSTDKQIPISSWENSHTREHWDRAAAAVLADYESRVSERDSEPPAAA